MPIERKRKHLPEPRRDAVGDDRHAGLRDPFDQPPTSRRVISAIARWRPRGSPCTGADCRQPSSGVSSASPAWRCRAQRGGDQVCDAPRLVSPRPGPPLCSRRAGGSRARSRHRPASELPRGLRQPKPTQSAGDVDAALLALARVGFRAPRESGHALRRGRRPGSSGSDALQRGTSPVLRWPASSISAVRRRRRW